MKVVILFHKKPDMATEDSRSLWRENGSLGAKIPGVQKYVQNHIIGTPDGSTPAYDGLSEVWFDSNEAFEQASATPEAQAAIGDLPNFIDIDRVQTFIVDEIDVV